MGEEYKTELEIELEKALEERGILFSLINKDVYKKFKEIDFAQYPEPPVPTEDLDEEDLEFMPEAVKEYKKEKEEEYKQKHKDWADEVGQKGVFAWLDKMLELQIEEVEELAKDKGWQDPFKLSSIGVYKERTAEIGDFLIVYGVVCDTEEPERAYNKEGLMLEGIHLYKTQEDIRENVISIKFENQKYRKTSIGEDAREVWDDISELRIIKRKYAHRKKVEPKHVIEDIMNLIS